MAMISESESPRDFYRDETKEEGSSGSKTIQKRSCAWPVRDNQNKMPRLEILHKMMSSLPIDVLYEMTKDLNLPDFFSMGRVCSKWRSFFLARRQIYLACMPPLAMSTKYHGKKSVDFCSMDNGERYSTKFMDYRKKRFNGCSYGFIILEDSSHIWFLNPMTFEQLEFLKPHRSKFNFTERPLLMKLGSTQDYFTVLLNKESQTILASRYGSGIWSAYSYKREPWHIIDMAVTNDRVLGLMSDGSIGILILLTPMKLITYKMKTKSFRDDSKLVVSITEHPMVVEPTENRRFEVFRADFDVKEWVLTENLGDLALFTDERQTYTLCDPRAWGKLTNCVYNLDNGQNTCSVYSFSSNIKIEEISIQRIPCSYTRSWYFPHKAHKVPHVVDDDRQHPQT